MDFRWHPNPLKTSVFLTPSEMEVVKQKLIADELEDKIIEARLALEDGDTSRALAALALVSGETERRAEARLKDLVGELEAGEHLGDCTRVPCSCMKCWAEHFATASTVSGAPHGALSYVGDAFNGDVSSGEAIARLRSYDPTADWADEATMARWKREASEAADWLEGYTCEHFFEPIGR